MTRGSVHVAVRCLLPLALAACGEGPAAPEMSAPETAPSVEDAAPDVAPTPLEETRAAPATVTLVSRNLLHGMGDEDPSAQPYDRLEQRFDLI